MIKSIRVQFDKILHDTGKALLININGEEKWIPKKLCRNIIINKKLGGNLCIPSFFAEKIGIEINAEISITHHIPEHKDKRTIQYDAELFR